MKKLIKTIEGGILQITTIDERWYIQGETVVPSVTWITSHYPKGVAFYKWLASKGWNEAEAIKSAAGDKGSKVHYAVADLIDGKEIKMDDKYSNPSTGEMEELSLEEYECLMSFVDWFNIAKPKTLRSEVVGFGDGYAGTIDWIGYIPNPKTNEGELYIVDFKTGQYVWAEQELQISAYKRMTVMGKDKKPIDLSNAKLALLQLGYRMNKRKWKFNEVEDKYNCFLAAREIWANETAGQKPSQKDYPMVLQLSKD